VNAATGEPLDGASVSLDLVKDLSAIQSTRTGADGRFVFDRLPAAKYALSGSHRGFITGSYDDHEGFSTAIVTGNGLVSENLVLRLLPEAVISGVVAEDSGDPVENAKVSLYRQSHASGMTKIQLAGSTIVDDSGAYEFTDLAPGDYFLAASGRPWYADNNAGMVGLRTHSPLSVPHSPLDLAYATTFYADVNDSDSATPIPLKGGDRVQINFALHPVPAVHLVVHFPAPDDRRRRNIGGTPILAEEIFGNSDYIETNSRYIAPGETEISVAPGEYVIHLSGGPVSPAERLTKVDVSADAAVDAGTGVLTANVSGKLAMLSGEAFATNTFITLISPDGNQSVNGAIVQKDGTFALSNVPPGRYRLSCMLGNEHFFVARLAASGAEISDGWIQIASNPVMLAATVYPDPNLDVTGFAKRDGKASSGAMIVLVPQDPANNRDLFRRDQSDSDGSFVFHDVIPGKYTVVAIEDGWTLDWADANVIAHYLPHGQPIAITERSPKTTPLPEAAEVQPK
jgi:hypothetical protein